MSSIDVLYGMCKGKRIVGSLWLPVRKALLLNAALLCWAVPGWAASAEPDGEARLGTRSGEAVITRDPESGSRIMRTPDPQPQPEYQGPQTIIVAPEVYPNRRPGAGPRPRHAERPSR